MADNTITTQAITKLRKIAIIGFAASGVHDAPYDDPTWELWGINELWRQVPFQKFALWFDLHSPQYINEQAPAQHAWLKKLGIEDNPAIPVFMQEAYVDAYGQGLPTVQPFPKEELLNEFGPYFTSSIAWLLGYAIYTKVDTIGIWGVDMLHQSEYTYQRACCDYYIGLARGRGIHVHLPDTCALARAPQLYGYTDLAMERPRYGNQRYKHRKAKLQEARDQALTALHTLDGQLATVQSFGTSIVEDGIDRDLIGWCARDIPVISDKLVEMLRERVEQYRHEILQMLQPKREQAMQTLYTADGCLQEIEYWWDIIKHLRRGGV